MRILPFLIIFWFFQTTTMAVCGQENLSFPKNKLNKYVDEVDKKAADLNKRITNYTDRALAKILKQEQKMYHKVRQTDSTLANKLFKYALDSIQHMKARIQSKGAKVNRLFSGKYFPALDTLTQTIGFIKDTKNLLSKSKQLTSSLAEFKEIENKLSQTENIQNFLTDRKQILSEYLNKFPNLTKHLSLINKEAYYYAAQINEYKSNFSNPQKLEELIISGLRKLPAFDKFFQENSVLSQLSGGAGFNMGSLATSSAPIFGIAARSSVQQTTLVNSVGTIPNASQMVNGQIQQIEAGFREQAKRFLTQNSSAGNDLPDFTPNSQRVKSFWKRLEYSTDIQFAKASTFLLPATGTIGLQAGYKLNDKCSAGFGAAYVFGLGSGWKDIHLTNQGLGFRTYLSLRIKGNFFVQGGSEWNYNTLFKTINELKNEQSWQQSGLVGVSKKYNVSGKLKGNIQLLFDFLYNSHLPRTNPILFRVGYGF